MSLQLPAQAAADAREQESLDAILDELRALRASCGVAPPPPPTTNRTHGHAVSFGGASAAVPAGNGGDPTRTPITPVIASETRERAGTGVSQVSVTSLQSLPGVGGGPGSVSGQETPPPPHSRADDRDVRARQEEAFGLLLSELSVASSCHAREKLLGGMLAKLPFITSAQVSTTYQATRSDMSKSSTCVRVAHTHTHTHTNTHTHTHTHTHTSLSHTLIFTLSTHAVQTRAARPHVPIPRATV
jgi:hypothetical protein